MTVSPMGADSPAANIDQGGRCRHHWVIDEPNGPSSWGRCRICGASREFLNNPEAARIDRQGANGNNHH